MEDDNRESNFWVSYSDLATGMMIIFMLVMLLMVAIQQINTAMQQEAVEAVVQKLQIIMGTKPKFAEEIQEGFKKAAEERDTDLQVQVDAVTAQLEIQDTLLTFEVGDDVLKPKGQKFLHDFTPPYVCALWTQRQADECSTESEQNDVCERLSPHIPGAVKRILVTGSADMFDSSVYKNHELASDRAQTVVKEMLRQLDSIADPAKRSIGVFSPNTKCADNPRAVYDFARERLWAAGSGDTQHCSDVLDNGELLDCRNGRTIKAPNYRRVTFELEIAGDDMTGMLLHMVNLVDQVGGSNSNTPINSAFYKQAETVANKCWGNHNSYQGCSDFVDYCLTNQFKAQTTNYPNEAARTLANICQSYYSELKTGNTQLKHLTNDICEGESAKPGCTQAINLMVTP